MHYILEEWELKGEKGEGGGEFRLKEIVTTVFWVYMQKLIYLKREIF